MKLAPLLKLLGIGGGLTASGVGILAAGQIVFGVALIGSCEFRSSGPGQCDRQWSTAQALLFGGAATGLGLNTLNPLLRDEKPRSRRKRDARGRFEGGPSASDY